MQQFPGAGTGCTFSDVRGDGNGGTSHLRCQTEGLLTREGRSDLIETFYQINCGLPGAQIAMLAPQSLPFHAFTP